MSLKQSIAPSSTAATTTTTSTTMIARGRQRRLPMTLAALLAAAAVVVVGVLAPPVASASTRDDNPAMAGGLLRGGGTHIRRPNIDVVDGVIESKIASRMRHRELGGGGGGRNDDDKDKDKDERKNKKNRIRDENDDRKDANKKMRDREEDKRKKRKRGKTNKDTNDNDGDDDVESKADKPRPRPNGNGNDDDDESKAGKRPKQPKNDKNDGPSLNINMYNDEIDDDDDDEGESKADKPKPVSEAIKEEDEDQEDDEKNVMGPPYEDKKVLLFALEYLGIDPEQFPYMSKEERENVLKMMDGILDIDLNGGGSDGMAPLLSDGNPTGIVYDPEPSTSLPPRTEKWNLDGSCMKSAASALQLESFEDGDGIIPAMNGITAMQWKTMSTDPWSQSTANAHDGRWSSRSGITENVRRGTKASTPVYSNLTLTTESMFGGGVLTFKLHAETLGLPREALFVLVDGIVESTIGGGGGTDRGWVEYSVAVGYGAHDVTWSHAYNPFGLESLPRGGGTENGGLWMDDVRYAPFMESFDRSQVKMINGGCVGKGDATRWKVESGGSIISASSSDIRSSDDSADISFTVYTEKGGMLTYGLHTSTTGPHDDFAILLNDGGNEETVAAAIFGDMTDFESKSLSVPKGKVTITLQHRKDPGRLGNELLGSLGRVGTDGVTRVKDLRFETN